MSVREELFEALTDGGWRLAPGEADAVNGLLDAYAHELAEGLRKIMGPRKPYRGEQQRAVRYISGWHDAADHIDPEVQK